jgi:hypothetical protein
MNVWIHLLLMANHEESSFIWNSKKQTLKSGQLLTGRKKLSKATGVTPSQVYKILKYLEMEQQIEQETTTKFTVITILNWDDYQKVNSKSNSRVTAEEQQSNTYKNNKNEKNDKKREGPSVLSQDSFKRELVEKFSLSEDVVTKELEKMTDWLKSKGKRYKDYKAFARNWVRRGIEDGNLKDSKRKPRPVIT